MSRLDATTGRVQRCDAWLCLWMNAATRHAPVRQAFRALSWLGDGIAWYALMLALLLQGGRKPPRPCCT